MEVASETGASTWLSMLPIQEHGFEGSRKPNLLPSTCVCGKTLSIERASCGGYPSIRHNKLLDITATLLTEVCHSVRTEPCLQPLSFELLKYISFELLKYISFELLKYISFELLKYNDVDDAHVDIVAENFWCQSVQSFCQVLCERIIDPTLSSFRTGQETCL